MSIPRRTARGLRPRARSRTRMLGLGQAAIDPGREPAIPLIACAGKSFNEIVAKNTLGFAKR
jgi:hypothetical protein